MDARSAARSDTWSPMSLSMMLPRADSPLSCSPGTPLVWREAWRGELATEGCAEWWRDWARVGALDGTRPLVPGEMLSLRQPPSYMLPSAHTSRPHPCRMSSFHCPVYSSPFAYTHVPSPFRRSDSQLPSYTSPSDHTNLPYPHFWSLCQFPLYWSPLSSRTVPSGPSIRSDAAVYTPHPSRMLSAKLPTNESLFAYWHVPLPCRLSLTHGPVYTSPFACFMVPCPCRWSCSHSPSYFPPSE
mmetsp:Transcript_63627/g.149741  ORF Transcript_63627/g.149741 Transcript_63627/m.149741 type:complete len:242 (+) Transcript_63627:206-931(+)